MIIWWLSSRWEKSSNNYWTAIATLTTLCLHAWTPLEVLTVLRITKVIQTSLLLIITTNSLQLSSLLLLFKETIAVCIHPQGMEAILWGHLRLIAWWVKVKWDKRRKILRHTRLRLSKVLKCQTIIFQVRYYNRQMDNICKENHQFRFWMLQVRLLQWHFHPKIP